ncbi:MAG TPA: peptidoglycan-binding domain-containing protein [Terriglobales bacterium]|nr:peptidoglycan-binding domain-containing protein [Terriglobales bacterium]
MSPQQAEVASPVTERQSLPPEPVDEPANKSVEKPVVRKLYSPEEIRRLQFALKEVGFDPGPVDGVAGNKTKAALERLQGGCAQAKPFLMENLSNKGAALSPKSYTREQVLTIQTELKRAGFIVGPADGIFGSRTRAVVAHIRSLCPSMPEYASLLAEQTEMAKSKSPASSLTRDARLVSAGAPVRAEPVKAIVAPPARTEEEIRILQLRLRDAGFDPGPFDGVMGPKTEKALQEYQAAHRAGKVKTSLTTGISAPY